MSNILEYKGYRAKVEYSSEDNILFGKIEGINSLVTFEAESTDDVKNAFEEAVDNYLAFCEENNISPEKEYKGCFNVRVSPVVHKRISIASSKENISLNKYVENALVSYLDKDKYVECVKIVTKDSWLNSYSRRDYLNNRQYVLGGIKQ